MAKISNARSALAFFLAFALFYIFLLKVALTPLLPSPSHPILLYSNQSRSDLRLVLKNSFRKAAHTIDLWMYAATDPLLLKQLCKQADQNIQVTLRFDHRGGTPPLPNSLHPTPIKSRGLMHRKIVIIDQALLFLGSANMTTSSLQLHDNLTIGIYHPGLAQFLLAPSHHLYTFMIGSLEGRLFLLPNLQALAHLEEQLNRAHSSIFVAMFTLTHPALIDALIHAHERGVSVQVALDRYTARGASKKSVSRLLQAGIPLLLSSSLPLLHHKWAYIDRTQLVMGSTNWTQAAFTKNDDCLLFLNSLSPDLQSQIDSLVSTISLESIQTF